MGDAKQPTRREDSPAAELDKLLSGDLPPRRKEWCGVRKVLARAPEDVAAKIRAALMDVRIPTKAIARALQNTEYQVADYVLARHRRRDCKCEHES